MIDAVLAALRFAQYGALMLLLGVAAFPSVALRGQSIPLASRWRRRTTMSIWVAAIGFALAAMIASVASMMGLPPWQVEPDTVFSIVTGTDVGWAFLIRISALMAALPVIMWLPTLSLRSAMLVMLAAIALATLAWSGHAAATEGAIGTIHRLNDALHLTAAALWIGAIAGFLVLTITAHRNPDRVNAALLLDRVHRFAPVGIVLVGLVGLTGLVNSELIFGIAATPTVFLTGYGGLLAAKLGLVGVMLLCAARNSAISRRHAAFGRRPGAEDLAVLQSLRTSLAIEGIAAGAVIAAVALLGMMSPAP